MTEPVSPATVDALWPEVVALIIEALNMDIAPGEVEPDGPLYGDGMGVTNVKVADGSDTKITGVIRSAYGEETHDFGVSNLTIDGNNSLVVLQMQSEPTGSLGRQYPHRFAQRWDFDARSGDFVCVESMPVAG